MQFIWMSFFSIYIIFLPHRYFSYNNNIIIFSLKYCLFTYLFIHSGIVMNAWIKRLVNEIALFAVRNRHKLVHVWFYVNYVHVPITPTVYNRCYIKFHAVNGTARSVYRRSHKRKPHEKVIRNWIRIIIVVVAVIYYCLVYPIIRRHLGESIFFFFKPLLLILFYWGILVQLFKKIYLYYCVYYLSSKKLVKKLEYFKMFKIW